LAQCAELCWQLRGEADKRQVENCDLAVQHNIGLGSAVVITAYKLGFSAERKDWVATNGLPTHALPKEGEYLAPKKK